MTKGNGTSPEGRWRIGCGILSTVGSTPVQGNERCDESALVRANASHSRNAKVSWIPFSWRRLIVALRVPEPT